MLQRSCACGQHTGGGECEECKKAKVQRDASAGAGAMSNAATSARAAATTGAVSAGVAQSLSRAAAEGSAPIHEPLRSSIGEQLGQDFSHVRVHSGAASADAAEQIGARAYTLGTDIHLGKESHELARSAFDRLIAHEAIHTVQQGGARVEPAAGLAVSDPSDAAEKEADSMSEALVKPTAGASRSLALRDRMRASMFGAGIARSVEPQIQRDLTGKFPTTGGDFTMNMKTESHPGAKCGMSGTIKFKAGDTAPDSPSIRLLQVAKLVDLSTRKDYVWTGGEANRNKVMTKAEPGVEAGFFVDVMHGGHAPQTKPRKPREHKGDAEVSPFYTEDYKGIANMQDGSKKGKSVVEASLADYPGWNQNSEFSFETVAKAPDTGHIYGTVMWGFAITDASKGKFEKERAVGRNVTLKTTDKAIEAFNEFYRNPGASTAPKK
jgi:hypothetical protein